MTKDEKSDTVHYGHLASSVCPYGPPEIPSQVTPENGGKQKRMPRCWLGSEVTPSGNRTVRSAQRLRRPPSAAEIAKKNKQGRERKNTSPHEVIVTGGENHSVRSVLGS